MEAKRDVLTCRSCGGLAVGRRRYCDDCNPRKKVLLPAECCPRCQSIRITKGIDKKCGWCGFLFQTAGQHPILKELRIPAKQERGA